MVRRRFRHLLVVLLAWIVQAIMIQILLAPMLRRPRPFGVEFRTDWTAWALPSEQMAALVVVVVGILYSLVPEGHWRQTGKWAATALVALAHLYVGVEAPTDILVGVAIGVVIPLLGFRWLAPARCCRSATGAGGPRTWTSPGHVGWRSARPCTTNSGWWSTTFSRSLIIQTSHQVVMRLQCRAAYSALLRP